MKRTISIVIPVYNSNDILEKLIFTLNEYSASRSFESYEYVLVDDCSKDNSWKKIESLSKENNALKAIRLSKNYGQHPATIAGLAHAKGDYVVTMDDDLQHNPYDIPKLIEAYESSQEAHIVIAHLTHKNVSFFKKLASKLNKLITEIALGKPKGIHLSPFRLLDRFAVDQMLAIKTAFPFIPALMFKFSKKIINVDISQQERYSGKSNYGLKRTLKLSSRLLINNSTVMLDLIAAIGILSAGLSIIGIVIVIGLTISGVSFASGWLSLISSIYLVGGLILFSLGIIGKYLQRILVEVTKTPNYVIEEII
jgi:dolichol-phosphate mannosyltransferase/undecaprenyl-phosphate 4-deoxy-4-formamido-L-arabinose transferase